MITQQMRDIVQNHTIGYVASVNADGTPNLSPKGTMVVLDDHHLAFGEIRSPTTLENIRRQPIIEINFLDIFARKCFRARGSAEIITATDAAFASLRPYFARWADFRIRNIVRVSLSTASIITSPAYDLGQDEASLRAQYRAHYAGLA